MCKGFNITELYLFASVRLTHSEHWKRHNYNYSLSFALFNLYFYFISDSCSSTVSFCTLWADRVFEYLIKWISSDGRKSRTTGSSTNNQHNFIAYIYISMNININRHMVSSIQVIWSHLAILQFMQVLHFHVLQAQSLEKKFCSFLGSKCTANYIF